MIPVQDALLIVFAGAVILLIAATTVGSILGNRAGRGEPRIENFVSHVRALWFMAFVLTGALLLGRGATVILFALCSFAALREFVTLTRARGADNWVLAALFYVVLPVQYWAVWTDWYGFASIFIPTYVFLLLPAITAARGDKTDFLVRVAEVQWAAMIAIYCLSYMPLMLGLDLVGFEGRSVLLIGFFVCVVQIGDAVQYLVGRWTGRRRVAPDLSWSKTWEGFACGVLAAAVTGAVLTFLTPFTLWQAAVMAGVASAMGFFGSLALSAVKRDRGVRDWGMTMAGHGGYLDRMDSMIFAAPIFFHLTRYFWGV